MANEVPFPWFGGKSRVAPQVWASFGDVPNEAEPLGRSDLLNVDDGFKAWLVALRAELAQRLEGEDSDSDPA